MKAIINADVYDFNTYRKNQYVLFGRGKESCISQTGNMKDFTEDGVDEKIDAKGALLMPGLIIGHAHIYSAFVRGLSLPFKPETFTQLLEQLWWRMDAGIDLETTYHSARVYGVEHIKNGITTIFDHHASGTSIRGTLNELKRGFTEETGIRALYCFETSDRFNVDECVAENAEFAKYNHDSKCRGLFGMHASLSVSQKTLEKVAKAQGDVPLHVHVGESLEDEILSLNNYGQRIVKRFDSFGLLKPDSILAHCVNIDDSEAEIISKKKCVVAVNPTSNMNTSVGIPDYELMNKHGIPVMIGNDSLGANITRCYQNMLYCMHYRTKSAWKFGYGDVLKCIHNVYGYASRMLGVKLGKIEEGYEADMMLVPYNVPTIMDETNAFGYMIDGIFNQYHPRDVFIGGEAKMRNYETIFDEADIYAKARECTKKYWKRIGGI